MTTLCDVIDNCTECPRYGDDCDGDKKTEHTDLISRAAEYSKPLQTTLNSDLVSRADAIEAIQNAYCKPCKERGDDYNEVRCRACEYDNAIIQIDALPSAKAEPIVIKAKKLMCKEDFDRFAEDIKRQGENIVCIPCDAERVSAEAVQGFRGGKIPPNEMLNGTVLIPKHQWIEMERELANLKEKFESAVPNCRKCAIKELWVATEQEDLVQVVRCKDCRHANKSMFCSVYLQPRLSSDFCNYGERREE